MSIKYWALLVFVLVTIVTVSVLVAGIIGFNRSLQDL